MSHSRGKAKAREHQKSKVHLMSRWMEGALQPRSSIEDEKRGQGGQKMMNRGIRERRLLRNTRIRE
jgi:hypothetical protein